MPMPAETETTSPKYLRDHTNRRRRRDDLHAGLGDHDQSARQLGGAKHHRGCRAEGVRRRRHAVYQSGDSTFTTFIAGDLGLRLNFYMDVFGGGSSTEALVGMAIGPMEAGMCKVVVIFRAMNGFPRCASAGPARAPWRRCRAMPCTSRLWLAERRPDVRPTFMRHMHD